MDKAERSFIRGERRLTMLLVGYWQEARDDRRCPLARDFTTLVPDELLADCFTFEPAVESAGAGEGGWLRDIGSALARVSGIAAREVALGEASLHSLLGAVSQFAGQALRDGTPLLEDGAFADAGGIRWLYRAALLPMENEAGEIALVVGGARCKLA